jgi:hypothetical protein
MIEPFELGFDPASHSGIFDRAPVLLGSSFALTVVTVPAGAAALVKIVHLGWLEQIADPHKDLLAWGRRA